MLLWRKQQQYSRTKLENGTLCDLLICSSPNLFRILISLCLTLNSVTRIPFCSLIASSCYTRTGLALYVCKVCETCCGHRYHHGNSNDLSQVCLLPLATKWVAMGTGTYLKMFWSVVLVNTEHKTNRVTLIGVSATAGVSYWWAQMRAKRTDQRQSVYVSSNSIHFTLLNAIIADHAL